MRTALGIALACAGATALSAQSTKVLFIGNSYVGVNDLPNTFRELALSLGDTVEVAGSTPGGYTFAQHVVYAPTLAAIHAQSWDHVVLQEQSQLPSFPIEQVEVECFPFAAQLVDTILANDSCTQPIFYMTWGRQNGDASNCATWPPVCTYEGMQALLRERYLQMAFDNDAFAAPAGVAWKHVREQYPMLNLYQADGSHPSVAGTYLVANVMYGTMFRASTVGATYTAGLAADTAAFLQAIASNTVLDSLGNWNIGVNDPDAGFGLQGFDSCELMFHPDSPGTHFWDLGDGTTSTEATPYHLFSSSLGQVTVTHTVTDACGRTATQQLTFDPCGPVGISTPHEQGVRAFMHDADLWITGLRPGDLVSLSDVSGRTSRSLTANSDPMRLPGLTGLVIWTVRRTNGERVTGRTLAP